MYQSKNWMEASTLCPFYISEYRRTVTCEGYEKGMESNMIKFKSEDDKTQFVQKYCTCQSYKECKFYKMIMLKYSEV